MPRSAIRVAAALLTLVLGAAGCKPSSLSPFWVGTKGPETATTNINGAWIGTATGGGEVRFLVGNNAVSDVVLFHKVTGCSVRIDIGAETAPVAGDEFSLEVQIVPQGRLVFSGRFGSSTTCAGSYFFEGFAAASTCPAAGSGQFTAQKQ